MRATRSALRNGACSHILEVVTKIANIARISEIVLKRGASSHTQMFRAYHMALALVDERDRGSESPGHNLHALFRPVALPRVKRKCSSIAKSSCHLRRLARLVALRSQPLLTVKVGQNSLLHLWSLRD